MKTAEEKANAYLCKSIGVSLGSPLNAAYNGFIAGYAEALRWRDPANEPPECDDLMEIKYSDMLCDTVDYSHDRYLEDAGMWEIEQIANILVLGWRPIR